MTSLVNNGCHVSFNIHDESDLDIDVDFVDEVDVVDLVSLSIRYEQLF